MHHLLIRHHIITALTNDLFKLANGRHFLEVPIPDKSIDESLLKLGITGFEIEKWIASLMMEDYIHLYSIDGKKTMFIKIKPKGMSASASEYFKEEYHKYLIEKRHRNLEKENLKSTTKVNGYFWVALVLSFLAF